MQRFVASRWIAIAVAFCMAASALGSPAQARAASTPYSGKAVFEGLFFGQGPVAGLFPELWTPTIEKELNFSSSKRHVAFVQAVTKIENGISHEDPSYFSDMGSQMTSGDPVLVKQMLERTRQDVSRYAQEQGVKVTAPSSPSMHDFDTVVATETAAVDVKVALNVDAVVNVGAVEVAVLAATAAAVVLIVVVVLVAAVPLTAPRNSSGLTRDRAVAIVTQRLAYR
jgi:SdpC family antimicrobial peptide